MLCLTSFANGLTSTTRTAKPKKESPLGVAAPRGLFHWGEANGLSLHFLFLLYAIPRKSQALRRKFTERKGLPSPSLLRNATFPIGRGFRPRAGGMCSFVFLFVEKCAIISLRPCPPTLFGREVKAVIHILTILESVIANVISHYICKWLDRLDKDRKPD